MYCNKINCSDLQIHTELCCNTQCKNNLNLNAASTFDSNGGISYRYIFLFFAMISIFIAMAITYCYNLKSRQVLNNHLRVENNYPHTENLVINPDNLSFSFPPPYKKEKSQLAPGDPPSYIPLSI
ncbi:hypothetical protein HZS_531 [Henneguya salminicola]|nr:hypothetical protein HZS_531 [Henneguya salminicola]